MLYQDKTQPIPLRVEDLLSRMTLEEKAAQLCGDLPALLVKSGVTSEVMRERYPHGHGRFTQFSTMGLSSPLEIARLANRIQRYFVEETRLGIPVVFQSENLCGYPGAGGTMFPSMTNLAATWEPELAAKMSAIIGEESRAVGITSAMSPVIDVSRDPRWGRTYETFGEDPYLVSQIGVRYIQGMQGDKESGVACIAKHFLGYAETQGGLNTAVSRINDRELYEVFATPFEAATKEADVSGMMASYSEIDGLPVGMNPKIARTLLRDTMGFRGMLTSDGAGVLKMYNYFKVASSYPEAGLLAKRAGLDTEIPVGGAFSKLPNYVRSGQLDEAVLDESVRRILTIKFEYGLFEHPYLDEDAVEAHMTTPEKRALADEIARRSLVLLKNDGALPLKAGTRLAVIGPHADSLRDPVSGYTYPAYLEMIEATRKSAGQVTFAGMADEAQKARSGGKKADDPFSAMSSAPLPGMEEVLRQMGAVTLQEALAARFPVTCAKGCTVTGDDTSGFAEAVAAAEASDLAVLALGGNCGWFGTTGGEGKDRCHLSLPGVQQQLLEAVAATGKPVVVVLYGPGIFALPWAAAHTAAMVQAWMPGAGAGEAVARMLAGEDNPGGHLPVTIPRSVGQVPVTYNHRTGSGYATSGDTTASLIFSGGYVDEDASPLFPFGHGLSYTNFALTDLKLESEEVPTDGVIRLSCQLENTGSRDGDQVVQLYTHFCDAHVIRPVKQLAGFLRVSLKAGEKKRVSFALSCAQLGYYNEAMDFVVEPGQLEIMVGFSAAELPLTAAVTLTGPAQSLMGKRVYKCEASAE